MTTKRRRQFTANFKKRVALEVGAWKRQAVDGLEDVFAGGRASRDSEHEATVRDLHAKIGAWMTFYSDVRPHSALGGRTPAEAYGEERAA